MESWDDENFEPPVVIPSVKLNKWEGEDEDNDVKESWEDEDDEKKEEEKPPEEVKKSKKKSLAEKIAEKERLKKEELERKLREQNEGEMTEEEKLRMQKESDLKLALETTFGHGGEDNEIAGLKLPETKEEYEEFAEQLSKQLTPLASSSEYVNFTESLARNLCAAMASADIKKIKNALDNLYLEKQKIEKGDKAKKNKGKGKAKLKVEENALSAYADGSGYTNDYNDFDDFM